MLIFSYRLLQLLFFPVILFIGLIRIFNKKENFFSYKQKIFANQDMNYFLNLGYKIVLQETRGIRTAWVLKKGKSYIGCRTESLSIKETCYSINLIRKDK